MILQAKNIGKSFFSPTKITLFEHLCFELSRGESAAITGRSGEGKTTLLHLLGGLESVDSGQIWIASSLLTAKNAPEIRREHLGFVFQSSNLLEDFTALENVLIPSRIARNPLSFKHGLMLLDQVGLLDRAQFPVHLLSGGERQRVAIARALCNNPSLILADEPSGNLDESNAKIIHALLLSIVKQHNKSLLVVTHDKALAASCDTQYHLSKGLCEKI